MPGGLLILSKGFKNCFFVLYSILLAYCMTTHDKTTLYIGSWFYFGSCDPITLAVCQQRFHSHFLPLSARHCNSNADGFIDRHKSRLGPTSTDRIIIIVENFSLSDLKINLIWFNQIWIFLVGSIVAIVACLYGVNWCLKKTDMFKTIVTNDSDREQRLMPQYLIALFLLQGKNLSRSHFKYLFFKCSLHAGSFCPSRRLFVRLIVGSMCLSSFILYQAYSSVLVSTLTMPKIQPLIESPYDIPKAIDIAVTVKKSKAADVLFMVARSVNKWLKSVKLYKHSFSVCRKWDR